MFVVDGSDCVSDDEDDVGKGVGDVDKVACDGRALVTCAKDELGRIHERNRSVEERGRVDFAHEHLAVGIRSAMSIVEELVGIKVRKVY